MAIKVFCMLTFVLTLVLFRAESARITIRNNCPFTIWPGTLTGGGGAQLSNTGFQLDPSASSTIDTPQSWTAGRIWARTQCRTDGGRLVCATADCGSGQVACNGAGAVPPATLAEFTLVANGQDIYDVSNVDGFNLPLSITPEGGAGPTCRTTSCGVDVNADCPQELAVRDGNGATIACRSACLVFNEPRYCCTGNFNTPATCPPTNYSQYFKQKCPDAYSYAYDDETSTFACTGASVNVRPLLIYEKLGSGNLDSGKAKHFNVAKLVKATKKVKMKKLFDKRKAGLKDIGRKLQEVRVVKIDGIQLSDPGDSRPCR